MKTLVNTFAIFGKYVNPKRLGVNTIMVLAASLVSIIYDRNFLYADTGNEIITVAIYAFEYIPIILISAFGGAVPAMMTVLIIFFYRSFIYSSFSYLTFIYLIIACAVEEFTKRRFFAKWKKTAIVVVSLQLIAGVFWGAMLWLLSGASIYSIDFTRLLYFFLNQLPGALLACTFIYQIYKYLPVEKKKYLNNGLYYIDPELLTDDEKYEVTGRSNLGQVVTRVIVFEAIILGVSAEIASNTLVPTIKYVSVKDGAEIEVVKEEASWNNVNNTQQLEHIVGQILEAEARSSSEIEREFSLDIGLRDSQFSVKLAMLISIIVVPLAAFVNRYAQRRVADPIMNFSKAVSAIYNSSDLEISEKVKNVHNLKIETGDEIEELYHAVDLTFYRLIEYAELVKTRQSIEDQLVIEKTANEAKSRFLSNISHEIRTPINAVLGFDEMILRESSDEQILGYARDIQGSGKTLLTLINDILDFSKIEAGKMEIIPVEYEMSSMINDLVNMSEMRARDKELEFIANVNKDIPHTLFGDEIRVKQCIINIITNAIKYTEVGSVTLDIDYEAIGEKDEESDSMDLLSAEEEKILLKIKVTDTGIGIKEEDMEKLNMAFERIDEKRNRTIEGTGLGINIVNSLLNMMGTKLNVESKYGKGSVFSFDIEQIVLDSEPLGDYAQSYKKVMKNMKGYEESFHAPDGRILVVDDTRTNLTVIIGLLKQTQLQVDTAISGLDAIDMVKEKEYDIIFLDHRMPEMDGIQTLHIMQGLEGSLNLDTPVVALTANAISGSREMYMKEGFSGYMSKPVDPAKLEEMILTFLPPEKISRPGDTDFVPDSGDADEEEKGVMQELLKINGVDVKAAIERCGSAVAARDVMIDFRLSIDERSGLIEKYEREGDISNYTIYVHGLKSSARAIGAIDLSEKAEYLEKCGNENNVEKIKSLTPELLELYRSYLVRLGIFARQEDEGKPLIDPEDLESAYASIKEFVSASYFDSADDIMKMLEDYRIPDEYKAKHNEVRRLMAAVDRDALLNIL